MSTILSIPRFLTSVRNGMIPNCSTAFPGGSSKQELYLSSSRKRGPRNLYIPWIPASAGMTYSWLFTPSYTERFRGASL
jgi:hypothetical protein